MGKPVLYLGNCLEIMQIFLEDNSVDAIITDPPYGLKFMSKKWDYDVPSVEIWREVLRVLKPGGYLLSFGGTRTYHRMVVNIEDAGFEIRDQIQWLYGSGFPKSYNISKGIDKKFMAEREVIGKSPHSANRKPNAVKTRGDFNKESQRNITAPSTDLAKQWDGFGTALKPANEPIVLARKPLSEKNIVDNILRWGTGGLNIAQCRVEGITSGSGTVNNSSVYELGHKTKPRKGVPNIINTQGRFPANLILDEQAAEMLDEQSGVSKSIKASRGRGFSSKGSNEGYKRPSHDNPDFQNVMGGFNDSGGASRFFYCAKASKAERNAGLEGMPDLNAEIKDAILNKDNSNNPNTKGRKANPIDCITQNKKLHTKGNHHPTVKPIKLMTYLCRLITPPGGVVLDPFMGSGTTGAACKKLKQKFIGIEKEKEYFEIAKMRIKNTRSEKKGEK